MLTLKTDKQADYIVTNVLAACEDINKLSKAGYEFLYLASGFIAHYNLFGFMQAYEGKGALSRAILERKGQNQWSNFYEGRDADAEYYHQKRDIYNRICKALAEKFNREHFIFCHIKN